MDSSLQNKAALLPHSPGVYLFKSTDGTSLYIGKADNLQSRVRQYFAGGDGRFMIPFLMSEVFDIEVIVTSNTKEALLLENTLIKKHQPRYNARLRDDSHFLRIRIDLSAVYPRFTLVRSFKRDGARYFGPYTSASKARDTLAFLERAFPLRTCTDRVLNTRRRACLLYQMKRCVAPCVGKTTPLAYSSLVKQSLLFLEGKHRPLLQQLETTMFSAAKTEDFEEAARIRDLIRAILATMEKQRVIDARLGDRDVWGVYRSGHEGAVSILPVRDGVMSDPRAQLIHTAAGTDSQWLSAILAEFYDADTPIPGEITLPVQPENAAELAEVLSERRGRRVKLHCPKRGEKLNLVRLACENARLRYHRTNQAKERRLEALDALAKAIGLAVPPHRIECFDNSNIGGDYPVAAMAVFIDGKPERSEYRRYKIKTVVGSDDYASMKEILGRRVRRAIESNNRPDLIVVDGGKGQLSAAREALHSLGLDDQPIIGLAKPRTERRKGDTDTPDKIMLPDQSEPIVLDPSDPALRMLQHLRDETHNHAIRYHRKVRRSTTLISVLEAIPGVGPTRRKALLRHLGSARAVAEASQEELSNVPGIGHSTATLIYNALHLAESG